MTRKRTLTLVAVRSARARRDGAASEASALAERNGMIVEALGMVERNALHVFKGLRHRTNFRVDELRAVGNLKLVQKALRFDPARVPEGERWKCSAFAAYARPAVRGAMKDTARRKNSVENTPVALTSVALSIADRREDPHAAAEASERRALAGEALGILSADERTVVESYYDEGTLRGVAASLGIGRVEASNIHLVALAKMRAWFALRGRVAA